MEVVCNASLISAAGGADRAWGGGERRKPRGRPESRRSRRLAKAKQSTAPGNAQVKMISALTKYHQYADGGCLNLEPIGVRELARQATVSPSPCVGLLQSEVWRAYQVPNVFCSDTQRLMASLKQLNNEYFPNSLFGGSLPGTRNPGRQRLSPWVFDRSTAKRRHLPDFLASACRCFSGQFLAIPQLFGMFGLLNWSNATPYRLYGPHFAANYSTENGR